LLRATAHERNVSRLSLDALSGLPSGYCGSGTTKALTLRSIFWLLGALGLAMAIVPDPDPRWRRRLEETPKRHWQPELGAHWRDRDRGPGGL
jgi:hypothetical protein